METQVSSEVKCPREQPIYGLDNKCRDCGRDRSAHQKNRRETLNQVDIQEMFGQNHMRSPREFWMYLNASRPRKPRRLTRKPSRRRWFPGINR